MALNKNEPAFKLPFPLSLILFTFAALYNLCFSFRKNIICLFLFDALC